MVKTRGLFVKEIADLKKHALQAINKKSKRKKLAKMTFV
jgi:hypothetical protein